MAFIGIKCILKSTSELLPIMLPYESDSSADEKNELMNTKKAGKSATIANIPKTK